MDRPELPQPRAALWHRVHRKLLRWFLKAPSTVPPAENYSPAALPRFLVRTDSEAGHPAALPARGKVTPVVKQPPPAPGEDAFKPSRTTDAFGLLALLLIKSKGA